MSLQPVDYTRGMPGAPDLIGAYGAGVRFRQGDREQDMQQAQIDNQQAAQAIQQQGIDTDQQRYDAAANQRAATLQSTQLGNQVSKEQMDTFLETKNLTSMVTGAQEYLAQPTPEAKERYLQKRITDIAARKGDYSDSNEMLAMPPEQREQTAQTMIEIGKQRGIIQEPKRGKGSKALIKEVMRDGKLAQVAFDPDTFEELATLGETGKEVRGENIATQETKARIATQIDKINDQYYATATNLNKLMAYDYTGVGTMASIFSLIKIMDNGAAVMDGDIKLVKGAIGALGKLKGAWNNVKDGTGLTRRQISEIKDTAQQALGAEVSTRDRALRDIAKRTDMYDNLSMSDLMVTEADQQGSPEQWAGNIYSGNTAEPMASRAQPAPAPASSDRTVDRSYTPPGQPQQSNDLPARMGGGSAPKGFSPLAKGERVEQKMNPKTGETTSLIVDANGKILRRYKL